MKRGAESLAGGPGVPLKMVSACAARSQCGQTKRGAMIGTGSSASNSDRHHLISIWQSGQVGASSCSAALLRRSTMESSHFEGHSRIPLAGLQQKTLFARTDQRLLNRCYHSRLSATLS